MSIRNGGKIIAGYGGTGGNGDSLKNQNPTSDIRQIYDWVGTLEEYTAQDVANLHPTWVCFIVDDTIPKDMNLYTNRNVGDIFFTTRLDEELNGAVECNGAIHSFEDFVGEDSIGNLLADGKLPYVSLTEYATLLSTNGAVGVFGWDGGNNTNFRVPTIKDVFLEAGEALEIGDYIDAGLPDHNHMIQISYDTDGNFASSYPKAGNTVILYKEGVSPASKNGPKGVNRDYGVVGTFGDRTTDYNEYRDTEFIGSVNDTKSPLYGKSTTVQPKAVKYRAMVQLVIGFSDHAVEDCKFVKSSVENLNEEVFSLNEHALLDNRITNCVIEIPQSLNVDYQNEEKILIKAGSKVYIPNGFEADGTTRHFDIEILSENRIFYYTSSSSTDNLIDIMITICFGENYPWETSSLPSAIARFDPSRNVFTQKTAPTCTAKNNIWYDVDNNIIKCSADYGSTWKSTCRVALPLFNLMIRNSKINGINHVHNGIGYMGPCIFALPGLKYSVPNGKNEDGTANNTIVTIEKVSLLNSLYAQAGSTARTADQDDILMSSNKEFSFWYSSSFLVDQYPTPTTNQWWITYDSRFNKLLRSSSGENYEPIYYANVGTVTRYENTSIIKTISINTPVKYDLKRLEEHKVVYYLPPNGAGNWWVRLYNDGWVEQGGFVPNLPWIINGSSSSQSLPIEMADTNYQVLANMGQHNGNWNSPGCLAFPQSTASIIIGIATAPIVGTDQGTANIYWEVKGRSKYYTKMI